jgi:hypothetical protein
MVLSSLRMAPAVWARGRDTATIVFCLRGSKTFSRGSSSTWMHPVQTPLPPTLCSRPQNTSSRWRISSWEPPGSAGGLSPCDRAASQHDKRPSVNRVKSTERELVMPDRETLSPTKWDGKYHRDHGDAGIHGGLQEHGLPHSPTTPTRRSPARRGQREGVLDRDDGQEDPGTDLITWPQDGRGRAPLGCTRAATTPLLAPLLLHTRVQTSHGACGAWFKAWQPDRAVEEIPDAVSFPASPCSPRRPPPPCLRSHPPPAPRSTGLPLARHVGAGGACHESGAGQPPKTPWVST